MQGRQRHIHHDLQYKNIGVGLLDLFRLKTEPHKNTDEQSDAHFSRSRPIYQRRTDKMRRREKKTPKQHKNNTIRIHNMNLFTNTQRLVQNILCE